MNRWFDLKLDQKVVKIVMSCCAVASALKVSMQVQSKQFTSDLTLTGSEQMTVLTGRVRILSVVYSLSSAWTLSVSEAERLPSLREKLLRLVPFLVPQAVLVPIQVLLLASFLFGSIPQWV